MSLVLILLITVVSHAQMDSELSRLKNVNDEFGQDIKKIDEKVCFGLLSQNVFKGKKVLRVKKSDDIIENTNVRTVNGVTTKMRSYGITCFFYVQDANGKEELIELVPELPLLENKKSNQQEKTIPPTEETKSSTNTTALNIAVVDRPEESFKFIKPLPYKPLEIKSKNIIPPTVSVPSMLVTTAPSIDCEVEFSKLAAELLQDKGKNVLARQFELTTLKMAREVRQSNRRTLEGLVNHKQRELSANSDSNQILNQLKKAYRENGFESDLENLEKELRRKGQKNFSYYDGKRRLDNLQASAKILSYSVVNPRAGLDQNDVAIVWFMDKLSTKAGEKFGSLSKEHNRLNISNRIAFYTGAIDPSSAQLAQELDSKLKKESDALKKEFDQLAEKFKEKNATCFAKLFESECVDHTIIGNKVLSIFAKDIMTAKNQLDIGPDLKIQLENSYIDLKEFGLGVDR
jgi:hypothetical protein